MSFDELLQSWCRLLIQELQDVTRAVDALLMIVARNKIG